MSYMERPEWVAFMASILEEPADNLRRLVLCDWLEELGQPDAAERAEFIRVQCEIERAKARTSFDCSFMPSNNCSGMNSAMVKIDLQHKETWCSKCLPKAKLLHREQELMARNAANWLKPSPQNHPPLVSGYQMGWMLQVKTWLGQEYAQVEFSRGFPSKVWCRLSHWIDIIGPAAVRAHPIEKVTTFPISPTKTHGGWVWHGGSGLIENVFGKMTQLFPSNLLSGRRTPNWLWFSTKTLADEALSDTLIAVVKPSGRAATQPTENRS